MIENHHRCTKVSDTRICPFCYSGRIIRNGTTKTRKQQYICKECHKRFLDYYTYKAYHSNINPSIIQLTKEGLGIRSVVRVLKISIMTLLRRIKNIAENIIPPVLSFGKTYERDEIRFFIMKKSNPMWLVYAIDKVTRETAAFYIGKRNNQTLNAVVKTLLNARAATIFTDQLKNY
ncbi:IS1 family transposase [Epilithonimonas zeae]|uniref:IS1 family transposase n=1 Tax=Epilithonimonas zeae TaxID=1416779 RepID=UPI000A9958C2|nr:IS1 family transposase [Epilithonimonas zeae]